ncbi:MAG: phosphate-starvation-inducible PsiE family protein [Gammaproteobacteria bacterium]|nr:phosphate-starvation-inducible PsiE family protein [Gammaproteobacteria bacterium]MDH3757631.1 phosphate-starvation-inducible PsiE family protein [Gammaproteobacteria bacterium]MDH3848496.1 phosphate-starvation-inducible PsiE family protein [Gammaproteobacteria bacterium]MDH3863709.1 phosphate-starvation-inducible PsiE family protein [Gammaproteobacteria bacterium]MDH3905555.1 phosphate-starvation-inducible PsiE family protein [Gammaproteobacteria bacterium]
MSDKTQNVHSGIRQHGIRVARLVEDAGLSIILLATLVAGGIEIHHMWAQRNVMLTDLLLMFIYVETVTMVKVYWESGKLPVRMPLYIAIVAIARYVIIDIKDMEAVRVIAISSSILLIAVAVLIVRWGHVKLPYPQGRDSERDTE